MLRLVNENLPFLPSMVGASLEPLERSSEVHLVTTTDLDPRARVARSPLRAASVQNAEDYRSLTCGTARRGLLALPTAGLRLCGTDALSKFRDRHRGRRMPYTPGKRGLPYWRVTFRKRSQWGGFQLDGRLSIFWMRPG
jgi:hypothetical protein